MGFTVPQRILLIYLLHFCTCAVGQTVNPTTLMNIVNNFENQLSDMGQYAVAFRVERDKCLDSNYGGQGLAQEVKTKLQNNEVYNSDNLIVAKADKNINHHSEYRLKNYLRNVLTKTNECVIYFTVNSPCLNKCISDDQEFSIKDNLKELNNYVGIKAFAFKKIWKYDKRVEVIRRLKEIVSDLPYYQCEINKAVCDRL